MSSRAREAARNAGILAWLAFILLPLIGSVGRHHSPAHNALMITGALLFVFDYAAIVLFSRRCAAAPGRGGPVVKCGVGVLYGISLALTLTNGGAWGFLFTYSVSMAAMVLPARMADRAVIASPILAAAAISISGAAAGIVLGYTASTAGVGLLMRRVADLRSRNIELSQARAEIARLAVAEERQRFARDLHDLLGHTLSVITLKAELAGRLLSSGAEAEAAVAAKEIRELEQVARGALTEVREAVSGYRELTLAGELAGARAALAAAGIEASVEHPELVLEPEVESVLAWAVREGTTNVIRHSGARHCTLRIVGTAEGAELEVIDDGRGVGESVGAPAADGRAVAAGAVGTGGVAAGAVGAVGAGGHGLRGLAERAEALAGTVQAGRRGDGGYRLAVRVPSARELLGPEIAAP